MTVRELIELIEIETNARGAKVPDRMRLLMLINSVLNDIAGEEDWEWMVRRGAPIVSTNTGVRSYQLPKDFGLNFVRYKDGFNCMISDTSSESQLTYKPQNDFYSLDLVAESNGLPSAYTIATRPDGRRELVLSPPPDANGSTGYYAINGVYQPADWTLLTQDDLPPIPNGCGVLRYGVLRKLDPAYNGEYTNEIRKLYNRTAKQTGPVRFSPRLGPGSYRNDYSLMSRRG